jgi:hypothetical protein
MGLEPPEDYPPPVLDNVELRGSRERDANGEFRYPDYLGRACEVCHGTGWMVRQSLRLPADSPGRGVAGNPVLLAIWESRQITAWPTGSSKHSRTGGSVSVGEADLSRIGVIARRLTAMALVSVAALDAYYGEDGDQLLSLYPLTKAGERLLRRSQNCMVDLTPMQRLENDLAAEREGSEKGRKALFDLAHDQAVALHTAACRAWNRVAHGAEVLARVQERRARHAARVAALLAGGEL